MAEFDKRSGTTDKGKDYEDYLIAWLSLKLTLDDSVDNFRLASNAATFGAFDDIIVEITNKNTTVRYAVQVKHNEKTVTKNHLAGKKGNFSIQKYFQSYQEIKTNKKDFAYTNILFTSASFDEKNFKLDDTSSTEVSARKHCLTTEQNILNTSGDNYVYEFAAKNDGNLYTEFFQNFYFYANQENLDGIKALTLKEFQRYSKADAAFDGFIKFVQDWSQREGRKQYLDKPSIMREIGNLLIRPFLRTSPVSKTHRPQLKLFEELCLKYDVTILDSCENSRGIYFDKNVMVIEVGKDDPKNEVYKGMVLILKSGIKTHFLLIGDDIKTEDFQDFNIFHDLTNLEQDSEIYRKISELKVSLQGRAPVFLSQILKEDDEIRKTFTTSQVLEISLDTLKIGEDKEDLPLPYISQILIKPTIKLTFLNEARTSSLCVLSCPRSKIEHLKNLLASRFLNIADYFHQKEKDLLKYKFNYVIVAENLCSIEDFQKVCSQHPSMACHHLRVQTKYDDLEWLASSRNVEELMSHLGPPCEIEECEITVPVNRINVICSKSGMGKSVMLKYLKNNLPSNYWCMYVRIADHVSLINENHKPHEIVEHLLEHQATYFNYNTFDIKIRERFVQRRKLIILWDGIDEVTETTLVERTVQAIKSVSEAFGFINWVTARHHFQTLFLKELSAFPMYIQDLTKDKQERYMREFLSSTSFDEDQVKDIAVQITKLLAMNHSTKLLGIPLHLHILGQLFRRNPEKYGNLIKKTFTLADMIRYFLKESINNGYVKKNIDINADAWSTILKEHRQFKLRQYEKCALETYLLKEDLAELPQMVFSDHRQIEKDDFGIVTKIIGVTGYSFFHNSCGEYLVANWFAKNFRQIANFQKILYKDIYRNIRTIFDIILDKYHPVHLAILYKDVEAIADYGIEDFNGVDEMGRTPLHVACSYGQTHPPLFLGIQNGHEIIHFNKGEFVPDENPEYKKLINLLLSQCNDFQEQDLYGWNCLQYAFITFSLYAVEQIMKYESDAYESVREVYGVPTLVFYSIKFNYQNIFDRIGNCIPYFENPHGCNMLHQISRWGKRSEFLRAIFKNQTYIKEVNKSCRIKKTVIVFSEVWLKLVTVTSDITTEIINGKDHNQILITIGETPLHFACLFSDYQTVKILTEYGADINCPNNEDYVPLHYAVRAGREEIVKFLVARGAILNKMNKFKKNELHIAVMFKFREIVGYLLKKGSKIVGDDNHVTTPSPLKIAVCTHENEIALLLLKHLSQSSENLTDFLNTPNIYPLHQAIVCGNVEIMKKLIECGFHLISDRRGATPLHGASTTSLEVVQLLIKHRSEINKKDRDGWTPLHYAASTGHVEIMSFLLKEGAEIDSQDKQGRTPLYIAVYYRNKDASNFLIRKGADINKEDNEEISPILLMCHALRERPVKEAPPQQEIRFDLALPRDPLQRIFWQGSLVIDFLPNNM